LLHNYRHLRKSHALERGHALEPASQADANVILRVVPDAAWMLSGRRVAPLAAVAVATELDLPDAAIQRALAQFQGIDRRLQQLGEIEWPGGRALIVDDYGHHPTEVAATLDAVRQGWPTRRLVLVFQPHRYTRTRDLLDDFGRALSECDVLLVTEVYAAGEVPIAGADGRAICRAVRTRGHVEPIFIERVDDLADSLRGVLQDGDVVLTMGAGNIGAVAQDLKSRLGKGAAA